MERKSLACLAARLRGLCVFRALREDPAVRALDGCLAGLAGLSEAEAADAVAGFVSALYRAGKSDWTAYVRELTFGDENPYVRCVAAGKTPPDAMENSVRAELETLRSLAALTPGDLLGSREWSHGVQEVLPLWTVDPASADALAADYRERVRRIGVYGYGMYAFHRMFRLDEDGEIRPVQSPDPVRLRDLVGYEREKRVILQNLRALLDGKPAANLLLTGDAGTGKSSTVKAAVNELAGEGLRILEFRKEQLHFLPRVMDALNGNPLKFVLFVDDLSFSRQDDNFSALKAMLEGSVSAKSRNAVIYATSNRRHLVRERFSDREGDDVHRNDTMQELVSLSERFGVTLTFSRPDKPTYLAIVSQLARDAGLDVDEETLFAGAERFVLSRASRSARAARQYVDSLLSAEKTAEIGKNLAEKG